MQTLDFSQIIASKLNGEDVIRITDTVNVLWELKPAFTDYLSFTDTSGAANRFALSRVGAASSLPDVSIEYSFDKTNWQTWVEENATRTLTIPANGTVYLRGNNQSFNISGDDNRYTFGSRGSVAAGGDIVSLVSADGTATALPNYFCRGMFKGMTTLTKAPAIGVLTLGQSSCRSMFDGCTNLTDVSLIDFSSVTLGNGSCYWMFRNTAITAAPPLTVTTTQNTCCYGMFTGCSSMTTAANVHLNAVSLSNYAYGEMFRDCSSLVTFPSFTSSPLTLATQSLASMFQGCTSMTTAPAVEIGGFASGLFGGCVAMFKDCTSLTDVSNVVLSATTLSFGAYKQMFDGCTALTAAPEIKATTLADGNGDIHNGSLAYMFRGCSSLANIKVAFTDWDSDAATSNLYAYNWVSGVAQSGAFECPSALPVQMDTSHIPTGWRVVNTDGHRSQYFGINDESGSANTIKLIGSSGSVEASSDNGTTWNTVTASSAGTEIALPANGRVIFRHTGIMNGMKLTATASYSVSGNVASLLAGSSFLEDDTLQQRSLYSLFMNSTTLVSAKDLYFGNYTEVKDRSFGSMFRGCTGLVEAPDLSSITSTSGQNSMYYMFEGCISLVYPPKMDGIEHLDSYQCCRYMFSGCTSLKETAYMPNLVSVNGDSAMGYMYQNCNSLRRGADLSSVTSASVTTPFDNMYTGCSNIFEVWTPNISNWVLPTSWRNNFGASYGVYHIMRALGSGSSLKGNWIAARTVANDNTDTDYFTVSMKSWGSNNHIYVFGNDSETIDYSMDNGSTWTTITPASGNGTPISVGETDKILFRHVGALNGNIKFGGEYSSTFAVSGNIDSLINGDNFSQSGATMPNNAFQGLFRVDTYGGNLIDASQLYMGAYNELSMLCCQTMFYGCKHLLHAPDMSMFTSMDGNQGCDQMFQNCKCLSEGVDLGNLTNLHWRGCFGMYSGCSQLNKAYLPNLSSKSDVDWWSAFGDFLDKTYSSGELVADYSWNGLIPMDNTHIVPSGWSVKWRNAPVTVVSANGYVTATPIEQGDTLQYKINSGSWIAYTAPLTWDSIGVNNTVTFRELKDGEEYGNQTTVTVSVQNCATPTISNEETTVTISADNDSYANASIHYTTDGSTPTSSSTLYTAPFTAAYGTTVKAISVPTNTTWYAHSDVASLTVMDVIFLNCVYNTNMQNNTPASDCVDSGVLLDNDMKFRVELIGAGYSNGGTVIGNIISDSAGMSLRTFFVGNLYNDWGGSSHRKSVGFNYGNGVEIDLTFDKTSCYNNLTETYLWDDNEGLYDNTNNLNCLIDTTSMKFKRLRIWKPVNGVDTLVFDGKAALKSGVYGIYDMVSGQLLTNPNITMVGEV